MKRVRKCMNCGEIIVYSKEEVITTNDKTYVPCPVCKDKVQVESFWESEEM